MTPKDYLDWAATIVGIMAGLALAGAATLAFLVQRTRYFQEVIADLELEQWPRVQIFEDVDHPAHWQFYFEVSVKNRSNVAAKILDGGAELWLLYPHIRQISTGELMGHPAEILPNRERESLEYGFMSFAWDLNGVSDHGSVRDVRDVVFQARFNVQYAPRGNASRWYMFGKPGDERDGRVIWHLTDLDKPDGHNNSPFGIKMGTSREL
jgi:hypothetical protein